MRVHSEYDFLLTAPSTRALYAGHLNDGPDDVAIVRAALREDARAEVRRNALVALTASLRERGIPDYVFALGDPAPEVRAEGGTSLANYVTGSGQAPNEDALAALRTHAAGLRSALGSADATARYGAARALRLISDPETDLASLLRDESTLVRSEGLSLAAARSLSTADITVLETMARTDPDAGLRARAVALIAAKAPDDVATSVVAAALERNDVDRTTADLVANGRSSALVPAIVKYLRARPERVEWIRALMSYKPTCAAPVLAEMISNVASGHAALEALRALSGHPEWSADELAAWGKAQRSDVAPCSS